MSLAALHLLAAAGGIAYSSKPFALQQNPAQLVGGEAREIELRGFDTPGSTLGGGLNVLFGGSEWGMGVGGEYFNTSPAISLIRYGGAVVIKQLDVALGINGGTYVSPSTEGTSLTAGMTINPAGKVRVGVTIPDVNQGVTHLGAGAAFDVASGFTLLGDFSIAKSFDTIAVAPGFVYSEKSVEATFAFGLKLVGTSFSSHAFVEGAMGGLGIKLGKVKVAANFYQPSYAKFFGSVSFNF